MSVLVQSWKQQQKIYLAGLDSTEVLVPSTENLNNYAHQWENQYASQILDLEHFVAEGTGNISSCEENSHRQWKSCANPDKAQSPSDQRKNVIIEKPRYQSESCTFTQRRPSVIPMEGLKPISKKAQTPTRTPCWRMGWSSALAKQ